MIHTPPLRPTTAAALVAVTAALVALPMTEAVAQTARDRLILPGARVGAVYGRSSIDQLRRVYGRARVVVKRIAAGEGTFEAGAVILPGTASELQIIWRRDGGGVRQVRITRPGPWRTRRGLRIGLSIASVQRLNGRAFNLSWQTDAHGCADGWRGGRLSSSLVVCFAGARPLSQQQSAAVLRYKGRRSMHPAVRRTMRVSRIFVNLRATTPPGMQGKPHRRLTAAEGLCRQWRNLRSQRSRIHLNLTFVNRSGAQRRVVWLGFDGKTKTFGALRPGQRLRVATFATHPWMVTNRGGDCLEVHLAGRRSRLIVIRPARRGARRP